MSLFSKSYSRGVTESLLQAGLVKFASVEQAQEVADYVGEASGVEPTTGAVNPEKTAEIAVAILEIAQKLASGTGTLITGANPEHKNTTELAAQHNPLAALDLQHRPVGYAAKGEKGVGQTDFHAPAAAIVGVEKAHPLAPGVTDQKANSVNQFATKTSSDLNNLIRKIASGTGSLVTGDDAAQSNTPALAAAASPTAALDEKERPQGTYAKGEAGVGQTDVKATGSAVVGAETPHDKAPGKTDAGTNSIVEQSKAAAFAEYFSALNDSEKLAALKAITGTQSFLAQ